MNEWKWEWDATDTGVFVSVCFVLSFFFYSVFASWIYFGLDWEFRMCRRWCSSHFPLPTVTLINAHSLQNKILDPAALMKYNRDFKRPNLLCDTETWLTEETDDINLQGYSPVRLDYDSQKRSKTTGGGLCMFVDDSWATNITVCGTYCSTYYELLSVSFRPHYLPRECGQITVILVYVPGPNSALEAEGIGASYNMVLRNSADDPMFLLGDFNSCEISCSVMNRRLIWKPQRLFWEHRLRFVF